MLYSTCCFISESFSLNVYSMNIFHQEKNTVNFQVANLSLVHHTGPRMWWKMFGVFVLYYTFYYCSVYVNDFSLLGGRRVLQRRRQPGFTQWSALLTSLVMSSTVAGALNFMTYMSDTSTVPHQSLLSFNEIASVGFLHNENILIFSWKQKNWHQQTTIKNKQTIINNEKLWKCWTNK